MRPDQNRVSGLIVSTVVKLCEKGLDFSNNVRIQGVIGVTIDESDTFVIHVNKIVSDDGVIENSPESTGRISSSNTIQEPSSSGQGAVSVQSNVNVNNASQNKLLPSTVKFKAEKPYAQQKSSFTFNQWSSNDEANLFPNSNKAENDDLSYGHGAGFVDNDEDNLEFNASTSVIKSEDIKPNVLFDDDNVKSEPSLFEPYAMQQPSRFSSAKTFKASSHLKQINPQMQPPMRARHFNDNEQFQAPRIEGTIRAMRSPTSAVNKMALVPIRHPRFQMAVPQQQNFQVRPRIPQQSHLIRAPRERVPNHPRLVNPSRRIVPASPRPMSGAGRGRSRGPSGTNVWRGNNAEEQVVEFQSGDGFSFNKQLTVLSRYSCNLCGKVYKNQRSVLHHQSQVHGRPKVKRRKKMDVSLEEETYEEDNYEEDYNEETW